MKFNKTTTKQDQLLDFLCANIDIDKKLLKNQIERGECKVDDKKCLRNILLPMGSKVSIFIPNLFLEKSKNHNGIDIDNCIKYRDQNILIVDKPQGIEIQELKNLLQPKFNDIMLTHRLDRNTAGLVLLAMGKTNQDLVIDAMNNGQIKKYYYAKVYGKLQGTQTISVYLFKDTKKSTVYISNTKKNGYKSAITQYTALNYNTQENSTQIFIELITGRTHQIRATMAHLGHFVLGDGKYGIGTINKNFDYKYQQLKAVKLVFAGLQGKLDYLNNTVIEVESLP